MISEIKNRIEKELPHFITTFNKRYYIQKISPLLFEIIKDFIMRSGKRIRPILFVVSYQGFSKKNSHGLYSSAIAIELLHDFMLVHDDIIDKSDMRRNKPSMHAMLNKHLVQYPQAKFNGQDLSIVVGDIMYAMAIDAFLSINEQSQRKEKALKAFTQAAAFTGAGEFIELLAGIKSLDKINSSDIYKIYDYKTARYTFCAPLITGAILAGANKKNIDILERFGIYLGRAFQIKDDILGIFGDSKKTGKSILSDLQEAKKTLLIWYAYRHGTTDNKKTIKNIFSQKKIGLDELNTMKDIIQKTGSLDYAKNEVKHYFQKAQTILRFSALKPLYKNCLLSYLEQLLAM